MPTDSPAIGMRLDALTPAAERRLVPNGSRAEHVEGVVVNEYYKERDRWWQVTNRGLQPAPFPWAARLTYIAGVPDAHR